jgi:hypothetical protein
MRECGNRWRAGARAFLSNQIKKGKKKSGIYSNRKYHTL